MGLREQIIAKAVARVERARDALLDELYEAAGPAVPRNAITTSIRVTANSVDLTISTGEGGIEATVWQWTVGAPRCPFPPHQALNGETFDASDFRDVLASNGEFGSSFYYPLDHKGCQCSVINVVGDVVFDPSSLGGPVTVRAFGQTFLVVPAAPTTDETIIPTWWEQVVTPENWQRVLDEAE